MTEEIKPQDGNESAPGNQGQKPAASDTREAPPKPSVGADRAKADDAARDAVDDKERNREGYAQRKLADAEKRVDELDTTVRNLQREIAARDAISKYGLEPDDLALINADTPEGIMEKAELLAKRNEARIKSSLEAEGKKASEQERDKPPMWRPAPKREPASPRSLDEQIADARAKL